MKEVTQKAKERETRQRGVARRHGQGMIYKQQEGGGEVEGETDEGVPQRSVKQWKCVCDAKRV